MSLAKTEAGAFFTARLLLFLKGEVYGKKREVC